MRAALVGLGSMGAAMARHISAAGIDLTGFDISPQARHAFERGGGKTAKSIADAANGADVFVVMVVNAVQVREVLFGGAVASLPPGAVIVVCSTIAPADMRALAEELRDEDAMLVDAPVSGGKSGAEAGALTIMASGAALAMKKARPVLAAFAKKIHHLGDAPGIGSTYKMVNQLAAGIHLVAAAELMTLGAKAGCDMQTLFDIVSNSAGQSWMFDDRAPRMIAGDFQARSMVDIFVKDLELVLQAGKAHKMPLPLGACAHQVLLAASAMGWGKDDDSAVVRAYRALGAVGDSCGNADSS